jgi:muramidase (phage lysozyme)
MENYQQALLDAIAAPESKGQYNIRYGGPDGSKYFTGYDDHPRIKEKTGDKTSDAAGRYQFLSSTWDGLGGGAFTPANQDMRAWQLADRDYRARTGQDLATVLQSKGLTKDVLNTLAPTWTGLGTDPNSALAAYNATLQGKPIVPNSGGVEGEGNPPSMELSYNPSSSAKSALQKYGLIEGALGDLPQITGSKASLPGDDLSQHAAQVLGNYGLIPQSINGVNPDPMKTGGAYDSQGHLVVGGAPFTQNADWGLGQMGANGVLAGLGAKAAALAKLAQLRLSGQTLPDNAYDQLVSAGQGARKQELAAHPIAAPLAEAAGTVVPTVAAGLGAGAVARGVGGVATRLAAPTAKAVADGTLAADASLAARVAPKVAPTLNAAGEFLGGTAGGPASSFGFPAGGIGWGNAILSNASRGVSGAVQGDLAGHVLGGLQDPNDPMNAALGAGANMLLGPLGSKVISPFRAAVTPETRDVANRLIGQGVDVRGGQIASSPAIKALDSANVSPELKQQQLESLTRAAGAQINADTVMDGLGTKGFTPDVLKKVNGDIGAEFNNIAAHTKIDLTAPDANGQSIYNKLDDMKKRVLSGSVDDSESKKILKAIDQIETQGLINNHQIDGDTYQFLTKEEGPVKQLRDDNNSWVQGYGKKLHGMLIDGLDASSPPEYKGAISDVRSRYMKLQMIEDAMKGGANSGLVDPVKLKSAIYRAYGDFPPPDLDALARAANLGFSRPALESGIKEGAKPSPGLWASLTSHAGPAGVGAGAAMLGDHFGPHFLSAIADNPLAAGIPIGGAALNVGMNMLANGVRSKVMQSPGYTNFLLGGGKVPPLPNPLIGPATQLRSDIYAPPRK